MSTERQIAANRRNAESSTGPRTPEGRAAASRNALQHGLTARQLVINTEDQQDFEALRRDLLDEHQPSTAVELLLVEQMIAAAWRLRRARYLETEAINFRLMDHEISRYKNPGPGTRLVHAMNEYFSDLNPLGNLARYQVALERSFFRSLHELDRLRAAAAAPASKITKRTQSQNRTPDPEPPPPAPVSAPAQEPPPAPAAAPVASGDSNIQVRIRTDLRLHPNLPAPRVTKGPVPAPSPYKEKRSCLKPQLQRCARACRGSSSVDSPPLSCCSLSDTFWSPDLPNRIAHRSAVPAQVRHMKLSETAKSPERSGYAPSRAATARERSFGPSRTPAAQPSPQSAILRLHLTSRIARPSGFL